MATFRKIVIAPSAPRTVARVKDEDATYVVPSVTRDYLLAGRAIFTVTNMTTGEALTFKVRRVEQHGHGVYFVNVKVGDGPYPYQFIGILNPDRGTIRCTTKSAFLPGTKEYQTAAWATGVLITGKMVASHYRIEHNGKCGRCGKPLTETNDVNNGVHVKCM